ncbi:hypothetical protein TKK_0012256 [Trichogramma kaykai]
MLQGNEDRRRQAVNIVSCGAFLVETNLSNDGITPIIFLVRIVVVVGMFRNGPDLLLDANPFVLLPPPPRAKLLRVPRPREIPPYQRPQERQE